MFAPKPAVPSGGQEGGRGGRIVRNVVPQDRADFRSRFVNARFRTAGQAVHEIAVLVLNIEPGIEILRPVVRIGPDAAARLGRDILVRRILRDELEERKQRVVETDVAVAVVGPEEVVAAAEHADDQRETGELVGDDRRSAVAARGACFLRQRIAVEPVDCLHRVERRAGDVAARERASRLVRGRARRIVEIDEVHRLRLGAEVHRRRRDVREDRVDQIGRRGDCAQHVLSHPAQKIDSATAGVAGAVRTVPGHDDVGQLVERGEQDRHPRNVRDRLVERDQGDVRIRKRQSAVARIGRSVNDHVGAERRAAIGIAGAEIERVEQPGRTVGAGRDDHRGVGFAGKAVGFGRRGIDAVRRGQHRARVDERAGAVEEHTAIDVVGEEDLHDRGQRIHVDRAPGSDVVADYEFRMRGHDAPAVVAVRRQLGQSDDEIRGLDRPVLGDGVEAGEGSPRLGGDLLLPGGLLRPNRRCGECGDKADDARAREQLLLHD